MAYLAAGVGEQVPEKIRGRRADVDELSDADERRKECRRGREGTHGERSKSLLFSTTMFIHRLYYPLLCSNTYIWEL